MATNIGKILSGGGYGAEYLRYDTDTKYIQAYSDNNTWVNIYYTPTIPVISFTGKFFYNGVLDTANVGSLSGMSQSGNYINWSGSGNIYGSHTKTFKINNNFTRCTILCSGSYSVGAYRMVECHWYLLNESGSVIRDINLGGHNNGYHDPYGIETFSFSSSYSMDVSGLSGNFKIAFRQTGSSEGPSVNMNISSIVFS